MSLLGRCYMWFNGLIPQRQPPPEGTFQDIVDKFWSHDATCKSLDFMWFGRSGGRTAFDQIERCDGCGVTFYWEGVTRSESDDLAYLCECCERPK